MTVTNAQSGAFYGRVVNSTLPVSLEELQNDHLQYRSEIAVKKLYLQISVKDGIIKMT